MDKIVIGKNFFIPMPVVLVGTQESGKANFVAMGCCSRANASPPGHCLHIVARARRPLPRAGGAAGAAGNRREKSF